MTVRCEVHGDTTRLVATLTGRLRLADAAPLRERLFKCLAEQPEAFLPVLERCVGVPWVLEAPLPPR